MLITIRTSNSQRKIKVDTGDQIDQKIKELFKIENYTLYSDIQKTHVIKAEDIKGDTVVFMEYEMGEIKEYKEEMKCTHSPEAVCPKCVNIDRTQREVQPGKKTKYLSYKSYLQTLEDRSMKPEEFDYKIKICEDHLPNQRCSKCMEKQITLLSQPYRYIDYVEFDSQSIVQNFINTWRETGRQKIGFLIGKYEDHNDFPNGRKAVISAIWEADQESFPDGSVINTIPVKFGSDYLKIVGVIYTDLTYKNNEITSYKSIHGYPISTVEIDFINKLREETGNDAFFGICVSCNGEKEISGEVFMITEQYRALRDADAITLTTDPKLFMTNREITYQITNEYEKSVPKKADPFLPIYYFIVKCECGYKENPLFSNDTVIKKPTLRKLSGYFESDFKIEKFKSFSVLVALNKFIPNIINKIIDAVINNDQDAFNDVLSSDEFGQFRRELDKFEDKKWACGACTYLNEAFNISCEVCGTKKNE